MLKDLFHAARNLRRNPGFALAALVTLALGIGATTAIFTIANALMFSNMPAPHPDRLIEVSTIDPKGNKGGFSMPGFGLLEKQAGAFDSMFAWNGGGIENLEMNGVPFAGSVDEIAGNYYGTLKVQPALGRLIGPGDTAAASRVAVIGYRAWQERYHGSPDAIGKTLLMNAKTYTIVGVHPKWFPGIILEAAADATVPIAAHAADTERPLTRQSAYFTVIGRLRDGVSPEQARAQMEAVWPGIREAAAPLNSAARIQTDNAARGRSYMRQRFTRPLYVLLVSVALLLLLACVNLANMTLARGIGRTSEFGIRSALGASRWDLIRVSLAESLLLGTSGALLGLAFATWASNQLAHFMWRGLVPLAASLRPDARVVSFVAAVTVAVIVLFGLIPAWRTASPGSGNRVAGARGWGTRALVAVQVALSFAILAGALLFSRSIGNLSQDRGFDSERLLVAQLYPRLTYKGFDNPAYFRELLARLNAIPGVSAAAIAHERPIGFAPVQVIVPGEVNARYQLVSPGYFDTLGMRLLRGRDFNLRDDGTRPTVAIVSAKLAHAIDPAGDALGRRVKIGSLKTEFEVVGIVGDAALGDPRKQNTPAIYAASFQNPDLLGWGNAIVRTGVKPEAMTAALRESIENAGREYPLSIETVNAERGRALLPERILALLIGFFGGLALLLTGTGLFGLLAQNVARRTREMGVRMALGASGRSIGMLIVRETALLLGVGLAAGSGLAYATSHSIAALLYGISGSDPWAFALAAGTLILVAALASLVPAFRAIRIAPMDALRAE